MIFLEYEEVDYDSIKEGDILCRKHFPYKPFKVLYKNQRGHDYVVGIEFIGKGAGVKFEKNRREFEEGNYVRPKLD